MPKAPISKPDAKGRVRLVEAVKTPLGFFVLSILVLEVFLGIVIALADAESRRLALIGALLLFVLLIALVAFFAFFRPEALKGVRPTQRRSAEYIQSVKANDEIARAIFRVGYFRSHSMERIDNTPADDLVADIRQLSLPQNILIATDIGSEGLRHALMSHRLDLVHLDAPVIGDAVHFGEGDELSSTALGGLLALSKTKLVILSSCNSFSLASHLPNEVTVIAAPETVLIKQYKLWVKTFYLLLSRGSSVAEANNGAQQVSSMRVNLRGHGDIRVTK